MHKRPLVFTDVWRARVVMVTLARHTSASTSGCPSRSRASSRLQLCPSLSGALVLEADLRAEPCSDFRLPAGWRLSSVRRESMRAHAFLLLSKARCSSAATCRRRASQRPTLSVLRSVAPRVGRCDAQHRHVQAELQRALGNDKNACTLIDSLRRELGRQRAQQLPSSSGARLSTSSAWSTSAPLGEGHSFRHRRSSGCSGNGLAEVGRGSELSPDSMEAPLSVRLISLRD